MIRFVLAIIASASCAAGQPWPDRLGGSPGYLHEYEAESAGWVGRTIPNGSSGQVWSDADAITILAARIGIDPGEIDYERQSAHIAGVRGPRNGEDAGESRYAVFVSAQPGDTEPPRLHRTWFRFTSPDNARGIAVVMPGMLGTPHQFIDRLERALLAEGWAVLRMLVPPSRATEHLQVTIDIDDPDAALRMLASELDHRTAECGYAVEAGLAWADSIEPGLVDMPRVIIGMSGTGMMLPAVLAWNEDVFRAAVIIGSGANAFKILRESSYVDMLDSVRVTWEPMAPSADRLAELDGLYLEHASLDAFAMAPRVADVPLLLIHGSADRAVPAATGDLLWARLGEPERWTTRVGHELLFVRTLLQIPEIIGWLHQRTAEDPS